MSGRTTVTAQQQTRIQQSVLPARNVPRVNANAINFRVSPGVVVPSRFSVVAVSSFPVLIDAFPDFRDDSFFVVDDEIIVVDRSRRVVDAVPVGPRTRFTRRASSSGSFASLTLQPDEIREVQQVLIDRGLFTGEVTGVLDTRTRDALITFQRQEGIQTTGSIDTRTVSALGLSNKIGQNQSSTVGQGAGQNQPSTTSQSESQTTTGQGTGQTTGQATAGQGSGQAAPENQSTTGQAPTTGQAGQGATPPPAQQNSPAQQNTTGQAAPSNQGNMQPPARQMPRGNEK
jgi:hypothetical protein